MTRSSSQGCVRASRALLAAAVLAPAASLPAQLARSDQPRWHTLDVGDDAERYLRALQVGGRAPAHQWSLGPFGPDERARVLPTRSAHPWARVMGLTAADTARRTFAVVAPAARIAYNSGFPFGYNDGAVWFGKGATAAVTGGFRARWDALTIEMRPVAFVAQNAAFDLMPNNTTPERRFADAIEPFAVDAPQRFGDGRYARVDPGQSTVRVDLFGATIGASTANERWGPALVDPLILGGNAAGIRRLFLGTSRPVSWGGGTVHVRLEAGTLGQSRWATTHPDSAARLMAGVVGVVTLRALPGLEVGAGRFFHRLRSSSSLLGAFGIPFERIFKDQLVGKDSVVADNQLASVFARWAVPAAGLEAYAELGRNDHSQNARDLLAEPDHNSAYVAGLQRVWGGRPDRLVALRAETMNARITHIVRVRGQTRWAQHTPIRQGHTQHGELLGSAAGLGGSATTLGLDVYRPDGRWTFELARRVRQQPIAESAPAGQLDVFAVARADRLWIGPYGDLTLGVTAVRELNRDFRRDATNLRLDAGWRVRRWR